MSEQDETGPKETAKTATDKDWIEARELARLNASPPNAYAINKHYPNPKAR